MADKTKVSKQDLFIENGKELFMKHGFRRITVEDICKKAGISKMTFYRYFPNKTELAKQVFVSIIEDGYRKFRMLLDEDSSPEEKIHKMLMLKMEGTDQLSQEFLVDFYTSHEAGLKEFVDNTTRNLWRRMINDFRKAQQQGVFRDDFNTECFFLVVQKITDSLDDPEIKKLFPTPQAMVMEVVSLLIYGIVPRK